MIELGTLRSGSEWEETILNTIIKQSTHREITLRDVTKCVLKRSLLVNTSLLFNKGKRISKAVDAVIPEYL